MVVNTKYTKFEVLKNNYVISRLFNDKCNAYALTCNNHSIISNTIYNLTGTISTNPIQYYYLVLLLWVAGVYDTTVFVIYQTHVFLCAIFLYHRFGAFSCDTKFKYQ